VDLAIEKGKAIGIENLKKLKKGMRGDGTAELRRRLHQWNAKKFLQKLKRVAMLTGVERDRGQSRLYINHRHAKVCTAVKHR
jgi:hypothetical protein